MERYYIGGKQYIPEESTPLCKAAGIMGTTTLYHTEKGAFFIVKEEEASGTTAELLTEKQAREFMDNHAAAIDTDNYDAIFGEPEKG